MDKFEKQFEDMDVRAGYMEGTMAASTATSTPQEEVDALIQVKYHAVYDTYLTCREYDSCCA